MRNAGCFKCLLAVFPQLGFSQSRMQRLMRASLSSFVPLWIDSELLGTGARNLAMTFHAAFLAVLAICWRSCTESRSILSFVIPIFYVARPNLGVVLFCCFCLFVFGLDLFLVWCFVVWWCLFGCIFGLTYKTVGS